MIVVTLDQYNKIPNGTILDVVCTGDDWNDYEIGKSVKCLKADDKLYEITNSFFNFSERNDYTMDEDFSFIVIARQKDMHNVSSD